MNFWPLTIPLLLLISCNQKPSYTPLKEHPQQYIYDFLKIALEDRRMSLDVDLSETPQENLSRDMNDAHYLNQLIIEKKPIKNKKETRIVESDSVEGEHDILSLLKEVKIDFTKPQKCLTKDDVEEMLFEKERLDFFQWDNSFEKLNISKNGSYKISLPLSNKDRSKFIIAITYFHKNSFGGSEEIL
ncbi:MAG: hypothetical protein HRT68_07145, partial [Flavobacteriaceae bacterium]|nr:hypothetical protein [Flavobacteriaceae bacterium]